VEQFFLSALDLLCIADMEGRFLRLNAEWEHTFGYRLDELMGRCFVEFVHPEDVQATMNALSTLSNNKEVLNFVNRYRCKDGSYRWIEWRSFPTGRKIYAAARDITARREMEEALRESRDRYRQLFESMLDGFALHEILLDEKGKPRDYRFLEVNPAFERLTGLRGEDIRGRTVLEVLPQTESHWIEVYGGVALSGEALQFRNYSRALDRWFEVSAFSPRHGYFATIFTDITEQERGREERERLIAELERKNEELERFTYTVSHDLKSPLITIKGFLGLLEQDLAAAKPDLVRKDMERIGEAADRMALLLDDLLELSRVGRVVNPPAFHSVEELVRRALEAVSWRLAERGVVVEVLPGLGEIYGDGPRLVGVFQNLLENAAKYMGEQENPRVEIGVMHREDGIVYYVADNGMGIEPQYRETIFGLFNKLDPRSEGTGIGLALVRRIVEVHGGKVWVESEGKGKGAVFCLRFPPRRASEVMTYERCSSDNSSR
jgi:PAS domain S-box-containing protein